MTDFTFSETGKSVYQRTYSRTKADGSKETWPETVGRVVAGNADLVGLKDPAEESELFNLMVDFSVLPAGRHLWASGVKGRQYLMNCWTAGWTETFSEHFTFTFLRLMEGGGVGSNYSSEFLDQYGPVQHDLKVHIVCDPSHPDYEKMKAEGLLSEEFSHEWDWPLVVDDSREGWADALADLLGAHMRSDTRHQDRVFDVSNVRPEGSRLKTFGGTASGPAPLARMLRAVSATMNALAPDEPDGWHGYGAYNDEGFLVDPLSAMEIDHAIAQCVVAGGNRRSARMAMLPWNDPCIEEFIECKRDNGHWTTNISVIIDDEFIEALNGRRDAHTYTAAWNVLGLVAKGMLSNGEPGLWNKSLSQVGEVNELYVTNPCGEIALEMFEPCNLGHINLAAFAGPNGYTFDVDGAKRAARLMTRFLIRATYGDVNDPRSKEVLARNRRIGVGLFGVQEALALLGIRYSEAPEDQWVRWLLRELKDTIRKEARDYAFQLRIPEPVKVTTVAPTGTIAKMPGTTEGIHPIFSRYYIRRIRFSTVDADQKEQVKEYIRQGYNVVDDPQAENTVVVEIPTKEAVVERVEAAGWPGEIVESADELTLEQLLAFQAMVQEEYADNAVSFTANLNPEEYDSEAVVDILADFLPRLKGGTIFPQRGYALAPYERISEQDYLDWVAATGLENIEDGTDEECSTSACPIR